MANFISDYIKKNKSHIENYREYLIDNDWAYSKEMTHVKKEFKIQDTIVGSIITDLEYFVAKAEAALDHKYVKDFIEMLISCIRLFNNRCELFMSQNDWTDMQDEKKQKEMLGLFDTFRRNITKNNDKIIDLKLETDINNLGVDIYGDRKLPFLMRAMLESRYPQIIDARNEYQSV